MSPDFLPPFDPYYTPSIQVWVPIITNVLLVIIVGWQAWTYRRQWQVMRSQLEHAKQVQKNSNRAWVLLNAANLKQPIKVGERPAVVVVFTNTGRTPAVNGHFKTWFGIEVSYIPANKLKRPKLPGLPSQAVIGTNMPHSQTILYDVELTKEMVQRLTNREEQLYIHGVVEYDDVFGDRWNTEFCATLNIELGTMFDVSPDGNYLH